MYNSYFGFNEKPFTLTPNPRFIFLSHSHNEALAHLLYGIDNHNGFIKLIGEVGTGKTTLIRMLLNQLGEERYRTALIFNTCISGIDLLRSINQEFGIPSDSENATVLLNSLNHFLLTENSRGHTVVLVIDEAQNLTPEVLEHIRMISNLETESDKLIQIILAGQPELKAILKKKELRQLNQRIAVRYTLKQLTRDETGQYIRHRTDTASSHGGSFFTNGTILPIYFYTRGNPRMINILCDRALLIAFSNDLRIVDPATVLKAILELQGFADSSKETNTANSNMNIQINEKQASHEQPLPEAAIEPQNSEEIIDLTALDECADESQPTYFELGEELRRELELEQQLQAETDLARKLELLERQTIEGKRV